MPEPLLERARIAAWASADRVYEASDRAVVMQEPQVLYVASWAAIRNYRTGLADCKARNGINTQAAMLNRFSGKSVKKFYSQSLDV
jgi:hypothetical protein